MSKPNFIQVFEHETRRYDTKGLFQQHHFEQMVKFNEQNDNRYFTIIHKGVKFSSFVGVIQIGGLTIEVLPKADKNKKPNTNLWQAILLNMLRECRYIQVDSVSETSLRKRYNSILDVYFELYLNELERLVKKGLIRRYQKVEANQKALKGKLLFSQNIQKNIVHKERFYCEFQEYNRDHLLHQILLQAIFIVKRFANPSLADKINRLLYEFQDFEQLNIQKTHFDRIVFDRKNQDYEKAYNIAKTLILNYSPNLNYGSEHLLALLFDMNVLWEEYIFRILKKHKPQNMQVSFQNSDIFWEKRRIRPDIVIHYADNTYIIDTKWKIVESNQPSDEDLKQMFVYNLHWEAEKSILLYPKTNQTTSDFGKYHYQTNGNNLCKTAFISLVENKKMKRGDAICAEILEEMIGL